MQTITIHETPFRIQDGIDITDELLDRMKKACRADIRTPIRFYIRPDGRRVHGFIREDSIPENAQTRGVIIDGIETKIVAYGSIPLTLTGQDIADAKRTWTADVYVEKHPEAGIILNFLL